MPTLYAEGGNYRFDLDGGVAKCRVWRRPDVDGETGAEFAREKVAHFEALAKGPARAMVFDLRDAPPVTGPKTQEALGQMFAPFERAGRRIAVLVGPNAIQQLQMSRLVDSTAPSQGQVFTTESEAIAFARHERH